MAAQHKFIEARYDNLGRYQAELEKHMSKDEAGKMAVEIYMEVIG